VGSQGYVLYQTTKHLKAEFQGKTQGEHARLGREGVELSEFTEAPLVAFTGDTQIEFLDRSPQVKKAKILFLEVTYLDEKKSVPHAKKWGHLHLHELRERIQELECECLAIMHISRRYSPKDVLGLIRAQIPRNYWDKLFIVPPYNTEMLQPSLA
jgi:ribonuclease Z